MISERSSELNEQKIIKNEKFAILLGIFAQFLWALNGVQMKTFRRYFPESYTNHSVLFWRMFIVIIIGYSLCKYKRIYIQSMKELKNLKWFLCRNATGYIFINCWLQTFLYFRVSTISVIGRTVPLVVIILSVFLIGEKFYIRYIIGVLLCIFGCCIIIFNDRKSQSKTQILKDNVFIGILFALGNILLSSLSNVAQKVLTKEGMDIDLQNYYFGIFNCVPAFIIGILIGEFQLTNIKYIFYVSTNGLIFYLATYLTGVSLKYIDISKFQPITYLVIVFTFILCAILLGEPVFLTDIIGAAIIICFQYYNFIYSPRRVISEINKKENNINTENNS